MPIDTFGPDRDIEPNWKKYPFFRARRGQQYRCAIISTSAEDMFLASQVHFKGGYAICNKGLCCHELGQPRWRVSCVLLQYHPGTYSLHPWTFGERAYTTLRQIHLGNDDERGSYQGPAYDLTQYDINISCINEDFQQLSTIPMGRTLEHDLPWDLIYGQAEVVRELCRGSMGANLTDAQMAEFVTGSLDFKTVVRNPTEHIEMKLEMPPKPQPVTRYSIALNKAKEA